MRPQAERSDLRGSCLYEELKLRKSRFCRDAPATPRKAAPRLRWHLKVRR